MRAPEVAEYLDSRLLSDTAAKQSLNGLLKLVPGQSTAEVPESQRRWTGIGQRGSLS